MSDKNNDDFWNLDEFVKPTRNYSKQKPLPRNNTSTVEIIIDDEKNTRGTATETPISTNEDNSSQITRFIPPYKKIAKEKTIKISEYYPDNPLIKSVKILAKNENDSIFVDSNLFIRERAALLNKKGTECDHVSYYSFSPRYSQLSKAQLNWYLWWRENARNGIFLSADESYITLYTYELCATGEGEDKEKALSLLCSLFNQNDLNKSKNPFYKYIIRDAICDFCLTYAFPFPSDLIENSWDLLISGAFLPEFFIDLSNSNRANTLNNSLKNVSMYDYKRSKIYSDDTAELFETAIRGALYKIIENEEAFSTITSFAKGAYGSITVEHKPFTRMVSIVNKNIKTEITYYQLLNVQGVITDAVRYSENKIREHLGIKNKLSIFALPPNIKSIIDAYFLENYPPMTIPDKRRKKEKEQENEAHDYDRFYEVPKKEFSFDRAAEIEKESWNTTKILTEAFSESATAHSKDSVPDSWDIDPNINVNNETTSFQRSEPSEIPVPLTPIHNFSTLYSQIAEKIGNIAFFIELCKAHHAAEQKKYALECKLSLDEIADLINEASVEIMGDVLIENNGDGYSIIEEYKDLI